MESVACLKCQHPHLLSGRHKQYASLFLTLSLAELATHRGTTRNLCSWCLMNARWEREGEEQWTCTIGLASLLTHMLYYPTGLQQSTSLKMKLCRISRWLQQGTEPSMTPPPPRSGALLYIYVCICTGHIPMTSAIPVLNHHSLLHPV